MIPIRMMRSMLWLVIVGLVGCGTAGGPQLTPWPTVATQIRTRYTGRTVWQYEQPMFDSFRPLGFTGPDGSIYIRHWGVVEVLNEDGKRVRSFALKLPSLDLNDMIAAADGTFWVASPVASAETPIWHLDANGEVLGSFGHERLNRPARLAMGPEGALYVVNWEPVGIAYVTVFDTDGTFLRQFDFTVAPHLGEYVYVAIDGAGQLYVTQFRNPFSDSGVWVFDSEGQPLVSGLGASDIRIFGAKDIGVNPTGEMIYVAFGYEVYGIRANGRVAGRFGKFQSRSIPFQDERFFDITRIGVLPNGDVVIFDANDAYYQVVRVRF